MAPRSACHIEYDMGMYFNRSFIQNKCGEAFHLAGISVTSV